MNFSPKHAFLVVLLAFTVTSTVAAQRKVAAGTAQRARPLLGPQIGVATNNFDIFIGAQFAYPVAPRFDIYPSFDYYFPTNGYAGSGVSVTVWALNAEGRYWPKLNMANPGLFVGGGINYTHASVSVTGAGSASNSEVGLGLLGGWDFTSVSWRPFAQIHVVIGNADRIEFGGGVNFKL